MYQFVRALRSKDTMAFKELFRSVDMLMVDDVQFISGKDSTQEEFFHTFNALVDQGRQIVISADERRPTSRGWRSACARASAGAWSPTSTRPPTSCASASCRPRPSSSGVPIPQQGAGVPGAPDHLQRARAGRGAEPHRRPRHLVGRAITLEMAQEVLQRPAARQRPPGDHRGDPEARWPSTTTSSWPTCTRRAAPAQVARPRQVAMYLAKQLTTALAARDRPQVRRPRPHHGHARGQEGRGAVHRRRHLRRGCRAAEADAGRLRGGPERFLGA